MSEDTFSDIAVPMFQAALRVNKYHIALRHLKHIRDARLVSDFTNEEGQNLLHLLALVTTPGKETALQVKVSTFP